MSGSYRSIPFEAGRRRAIGPRPAALLCLLVVGLLAAGPGWSQGRRLQLEDLAGRVDLSDPRIAPDGGSVALVTSRPDFEENRHESQLVLVDLDSGARRVLSRGRARVGSPRWSPSGDRLAFISSGEEGPGEGRGQVFVLPMDGGEALQLTRAPEGVTAFAWRPDGSALAYATEDEPPEPPEGPERHNRAFEVGDNDYLTTEAPRPTHIWVVTTDGDARRITEGRAGLTWFMGNRIDWSPDGRWIAFASQPTPHTGALDRGALEVVEVETGERRAIEPGPGFYSGAAFAPDGRRIAYARPLEGGPMFNPHGIFVAPVSGGAGRNVTAGIDRTFYEAVWMPDGRSLLIGANDRTRVSMWLQPLEGEARRLDLGPVEPQGAPDVGSGGAIAFVGVEPRRPDELYYLASTESSPRRITDFNAEIAGLDLGPVESIDWRGPDGFREDGVLVFPPDFDPDRRYPLVLLIHGGPMSASTEGFSALAQLMAARGWVVFSPNYRGSDNLGAAYQRAVIGDPGEGPGRDVMAGLEAVRVRGFVDPERIAVSGWSYGGFMTTWLIGNYEGWRTAVAGAAVTDYIHGYAFSDVNVLFRHGFEGSPYVNDRADDWRRGSPITHAANVRTPTLLLSNTGDARVPITQSYEFYHALKDNGVEVEFVAYPLPGHFPADPVHQRDVYSRWIGWIADHFARSPTSSRD